ncbi:MAG: phage protease [Scytolyngbya sp. HA4215-MV1]|jgi:uncharacterized membrane-anchored protein YhcB (DUF1043 family)|nr:phage protease [Scytolyngbya sp. HA4215-MV1]
MKASDNRQLSSFTSLILILIGVLMALAFLVDCFTLIVPSDQPSQLGSLDGVRWQLNLVNQIVDRGVVPLVGLVLVVLGIWVDSLFGIAAKSKLRQNLGLAAFILSSFLGLLFLLMVPIHVNNSYRAYGLTMTQVQQQATQLEGQLGQRLQSEVELISQLSKDDQKLQQALASGQLAPPLAQALQQGKNNPKALQDFIDKRSVEVKNKIQTEVRTQQQQAEQKASVEYFRTGVRISLTSLLLAIGYVTIGWTGLKNLGVQRTERRKTPAR